MSVEYSPRVNFDVVPQIRNAVSILENIFAQYGLILLITSAKDASHTPGSLHYIGAAIDLRSKGIPNDVKQRIYSAIKSAFPMPTWWTDLEFLGGTQEHFHLGYNPARQHADAGYSDIISSFLPTNQSNVPDSGYIPDSDSPFPSYPAGTIPPEYFTPVEQPIDWTIYVAVAGLALILLLVIDN